MIFSFEVPGKPVGKERPRVVSSAAGIRTFTPRKTKAYEQLVALKATNYLKLNNLQATLDKYVSVEITVYHAIPSSRRRLLGCYQPRPDLDNVVKSVLDGLNGIFYKDDALVMKVTAKRVFSTEPKIGVVIDNEYQYETVE